MTHSIPPTSMSLMIARDEHANGKEMVYFDTECSISKMTLQTLHDTVMKSAKKFPECVEWVDTDGPFMSRFDSFLDSGQKWFGLKDIAEHFKVSKSTILRRAKKGKIKTSKASGRFTHYSTETVLDSASLAKIVKSSYKHTLDSFHGPTKVDNFLSVFDTKRVTGNHESLQMTYLKNRAMKSLDIPLLKLDYSMLKNIGV